MTGAGIGRTLVASLHQAVAEHLPSRAEFYAPWLHSESLRTPRVSVAGIRAALSFLRLEDSAYDRVVRRAGSLAAEWTWQRLSGLRRAWLRALPVPLRARAACRLVRDVATEAWEDTRVTVRWRRGVGRLTIGPSLFCSVRSQVPDSLCGFYAAALDTYLRELDVECEVRIGQCAACGDGPCGITVTPVRRGRTSIGAAVALAVLLGGPAVARAESTQSVQSAGRRERPIVMPFENPSKDPAAAWLGEGAAILVTEWLVRAGVAAFTRDERIQAFDRLEVPPLAALSRATVLRVGLLVGASDVIVGSIRADGDVLVATASRIRLDRGVRDPEVTVSGRKDDLADVFRRVAAGLFAGGLAPPPERPEGGSRLRSAAPGPLARVHGEWRPCRRPGGAESGSQGLAQAYGGAVPDHRVAGPPRAVHRGDGVAHEPARRRASRRVREQPGRPRPAPPPAGRG